ncbi:DUF7848 domain-containing protein [Streptomyces virginiae]
MSQPRAVVTHKTWTIMPDEAGDAKPTTYAMQCAACPEKSDPSTGWEEPQDWALAHSGRNPSHTSYDEIITRPWASRMLD